MRVISIVLNIFSYIFEQDVRRRRRMRAQFEKEKQMLERQEDKGKFDELATKMENWLADQMWQDKNRESTAIKRLRLNDDPPPLPAKAHYHTVKEHLAETRQRNQNVTRHAHEHIGHYGPKHNPQPKTRREFDVPGESGLEQLIYAQVILGPCRAHQRMGIKRHL